MGHRLESMKRRRRRFVDLRKTKTGGKRRNNISRRALGLHCLQGQTSGKQNGASLKGKGVKLDNKCILQNHSHTINQMFLVLLFVLCRPNHAMNTGIFGIPHLPFIDLARQGKFYRRKKTSRGQLGHTQDNSYKSIEL